MLSRVSALGQALGGLGHQLGPVRAQLREHAELVTAHSIRGHAWTNEFTQPPSEPREEGIAGWMAEAVVVLLEPVQGSPSSLATAP